MNKAIFFRNDDVWKLDENLKRLINIFLSYKIPLHLSVIPGRLTKECKKFLIELTKKYPNIIELGQHGFKHLNYSNLNNKFLKYEFGGQRSYKKQKSDILKGKNIMKSIKVNLNIFTPPWHGFDENTLKILKDLNYQIISTDLKKPVLDNIYNLKSVPTSIYLNKKNEKVWYLEKNEKVIKEINDINYDKIGIQIHHKAFNNLAEFNQLKQLLQKLKKSKFFNFIKLSQATENNISKKNIYLNSLIYYLTYQFVPKPLILTKKSKNPILKMYDFQNILAYKSLDQTESYFLKRIYLKLKETIKNQLPKNNNPIGLLLSGGMDSAIILHILRELTDRPIFTITGAYTTNSPNLKLGKKLASRYKTIHKNIIIKPNDMLRIKELYQKKIPQVIGDNGFLPTYIMLNYIKQNVNTVFSGDGADCLFCGLSSHYLNYIDYKYTKYLNFTKLKNKSTKSSLKKKYKTNFEHYKYGETFLNKKEEKIILNKIFKIDLETPLKLITERIKIKDVLKKQIFLDLNFLVRNRIDYIIYSAKATKVEVKMPFLNTHFVNFATKIPSKYLIKNLKQKYILKKTFEKILPKEILTQKKKGFTPPFDIWYKQNKTFIIKQIFKSASLGISKNYIKYLIKNINNSKNYKIGMKIWLILNLVHWFENQK